MKSKSIFHHGSGVNEFMSTHGDTVTGVRLANAAHIEIGDLVFLWRLTIGVWDFLTAGRSKLDLTTNAVALQGI